MTIWILPGPHTYYIFISKDINLTADRNYNIKLLSSP